VNTVMNLRISQNVGNLLSDRANVGFPKRTEIRGVTSFESRLRRRYDVLVRNYYRYRPNVAKPHDIADYKTFVYLKHDSNNKYNYQCPYVTIALNW
jgi:hypothetical protein